MERIKQEAAANKFLSVPKNKNKTHTFKKQLPLQLFVLAGILYLIIFSFIPMFGLIMGFKKYDIIMGVKGIFTSEWVGFKYFKEFFNDYNFSRLVRNTIAISVLKMIFTFPFPILFAIMLNEIKTLGFKKAVQTCSYLPHFISWVVISGIAFQFFSSEGIINTVLGKIGVINEPVGFLTNPNLFWGLTISLDIWKELGWWTIIFLAAIVGVNQELYESAQIDGASRLKRIWYITLPCIKPTIVTVLILAIGNLFGGGLSGSNFEQSYLLGNTMNSASSDIIQTYVFNVGLAQGRYAYATAVGMIQSVISLVLIFSTNFVSKRISGSGLF
ncbi:ABC transporter permease [Anaerocolumna sp. MB42-C2]|uniref:ABC transporter permease n=1 Tax=Anaerocolumna sp. MB42-C2 TaxID=3070997 RepID=UPI0027DF08F5|nr:ABC transporter permease subunit [Anaerocolumna sp. MB42-C2]WMJ89053.1 ABC transporter permease subunit [Anaerocolumna sp. MB42-C2]